MSSSHGFNELIKDLSAEFQKQESEVQSLSRECERLRRALANAGNSAGDAREQEVLPYSAKLEPEPLSRLPSVKTADAMDIKSQRSSAPRITLGSDVMESEMKIQRSHTIRSAPSDDILKFMNNDSEVNDNPNRSDTPHRSVSKILWWQQRHSQYSKKPGRKGPSSWVINPERSRFMQVWDIITIPALLWVMVITPVQVGMLETRFDLLFLLSLMVDTIFIVDLILQFFLAYPLPGRRTRLLERRHSRIVMHYLKGMFFVELLTVIPFDLIHMSIPSDSPVRRFKAIKIIRTLRLLKLIRIMKASRVWHRLEIVFAMPYQQLALVRFFAILLLICHWQSAIWAMTLELSEDEDMKWIDSVELTEAHLEPRTRDEPGRLYVASFYFCIYTMTSVGYGDIGAQNAVERIANILIVIVSGLCWAYILGEVCGIVADMNAEAQSFRRRMDNLNYMMRERAVPMNMRKRLRSFFLASRKHSSLMTQRELLQNMSPTLQGEISLVLSSEWLSKVSFIRAFISEADMIVRKGGNAEAYRTCIADIARFMDTMAFAQGEIFVTGQTLYILYRGLIGKHQQIYQSGDVFGEDFLLSDVALIDAHRCCALTYSEAMFIDRKTFYHVIEENTLACPQLKSRVREFVVKLAAQRGILAAAKQMKEAERQGKELRALPIQADGTVKAHRQSPAIHLPPDVKPPFMLPNCIEP